MTDEASLLAMLDQHPDDHELLLVCADWHEERGRPAAAELLRLEHRLRTKPRPRNLLELGATTAKLAEQIAPGWLERLARPSVGGGWDGYDSDRESWGFHFHANNVLHYKRGDVTHEDGIWHQYGSLVVMSTNKAFTRYVAVLAGDRLVGAAITIHQLAWTWEVTRTDVQARVKPRLRARRPTRTRRAELERASRATAKSERLGAHRRAEAMRPKRPKRPKRNTRLKPGPLVAKPPTRKHATKPIQRSSKRTPRR
jgi:uncharacterized protein (TIGR02996 family)